MFFGCNQQSERTLTASAARQHPGSGPLQTAGCWSERAATSPTQFGKQAAALSAPRFEGYHGVCRWSSKGRGKVAWTGDHQALWYRIEFVSSRTDFWFDTSVSRAANAIRANHVLETTTKGSGDTQSGLQQRDRIQQQNPILGYLDVHACLGP